MLVDILLWLGKALIILFVVSWILKLMIKNFYVSRIVSILLFVAAIYIPYSKDIVNLVGYVIVLSIADMFKQGNRNFDIFDHHRKVKFITKSGFNGKIIDESKWYDDITGGPLDASAASVGRAIVFMLAARFIWQPIWYIGPALMILHVVIDFIIYLIKGKSYFSEKEKCIDDPL